MAYARAVTVRAAPVCITLGGGWNAARSEAVRPWGDPAPSRTVDPLKATALAGVTGKIDQPVPTASTIAMRDVGRSDYEGNRPRLG